MTDETLHLSSLGRVATSSFALFHVTMLLDGSMLLLLLLEIELWTEGYVWMLRGQMARPH